MLNERFQAAITDLLVKQGLSLVDNNNSCVQESKEGLNPQNASIPHCKVR